MCTYLIFSAHINSGRKIYKTMSSVTTASIGASIACTNWINYECTCHNIRVNVALMSKMRNVDIAVDARRQTSKKTDRKWITRVT